MSETESPLLLVSISARALACSAARAGRRVLAADLFGDLDTRAAAQATHSVAPGRPGFDADSLTAALRALDPGGHAPLVYGSGFDANPRLLHGLCAGRRLLGNGAELVALVKEPARLAALLAGLGIPHTETTETPPASPAGWLRKRVGGAGGGHVRAARAEDVFTDGQYFQRRAEGVAASLTVLSDGRDARVLGYTRHLFEERVAGHPFLYGGGVAMRAAALAAGLRGALEEAAATLTAATGLVGLWCMDVVLDGARWWLIEVNPRPGASFELHERDRSLFAMHVDACDGRLPPVTAPSPDLRGMRVVYAGAPLRVPVVDAWPGWISDRPAAGTQIGAGEPVCTVHARDAGETTVQATLEQRRGQVERFAAGWREAVA